MQSPPEHPNQQPFYATTETPLSYYTSPVRDRNVQTIATAYDDARHALISAIEAPRGPLVGVAGHSPYNRLTALVNDFRYAYAQYRDALDAGDELQLRLSQEYADISSRAAQKLLDISPYDLPPEE
jgi:hypothetical protein